nr:putative ribonuclease H-like domain-containing protein [Tanacetum cinerariifolium]
NFMPSTPDLSFTGLDEFVNKLVVEKCKAKSSEEEPKIDCNCHPKQFQNQRMVKPIWNNAHRVNHYNFAKKTHPCAKNNMVPRAVLMKSGLVSINTGRQNISKIAVSVNTARQVNVAHSKTTVNAARSIDGLGLQKKLIFLPNVQGNPQMDLPDQGVINSGCSRHMTGNMSYLTDYEEIDGGYVSFGGNPKGGKITRKSNIKTESLMKKMYCLFFIDDYSRFTWVFFLATKDETSGIRKSFITRIENLVDHKVKMIRCDNGTEFKNREVNQFCKMKGILRQFSIARTPQQNRVAERRNKTLIEATRTMLADSKLPTTFWAEAVNTACYV